MSDDYEITILTAKGCPHCETAKKGLANEVSSGKVRFLDAISDKEGKELAEKFNVTAVPTPIINNKATKVKEVCELKTDLTGVICKNKDVSF